MKPMSRIYRDGFEVDLALAAAYRRARSQAVPDAGALQDAATQNTVTDLQHHVPALARSYRARLKRALRIPVKAVYRLLRPFVRPLAFRTRAYLGVIIRNDLQAMQAATAQEIERMSGHMLREVQSARELLRQDILALPQQPQVDQRRLLLGIMQEIQATRDLLRREVRDHVETNLGRFDATQQLLASVHAGINEVGARSAAQTGLLDNLRNDLMPRLDRIEQYGYANARRLFVNCADNEVLVRTEAGLVMCSNADHAVLACLIDSGELERGTRLLIERLLSPGDVFIDVGANLGLHTLAAARAVQASGKVIAFEPFDESRRLLEKSAWINGYASFVEIHGVALSDRAATAALFLGGSSGHHSLYDLGRRGDAVSRTGAGSVPVTTRRLDQMLDPALSVSVIKIDVEGAELQVIEGASATLAANPDVALIVEFGPSHLRRIGQTTVEWLAVFAQLGLRHLAVEPMDGTLRHVSHAELEAAESTNLLFARPHSTAWQRAGVVT